MKNESDVMNIVTIDTRGLPSSDLLEGYEELTCSREYFEAHILHAPNVKCVTCDIAEYCGLDNLKIYFHEYRIGPALNEATHETAWRLGDRSGGETCDISLSSSSSDSTPQKILEDAWAAFFPVGNNNSAATLLTFDPETGFAKYHVYGIAYAVYDDGHYPLSKEQVWGLQELANEVKDIYFCDPKHELTGKKALSRWCRQYQEHRWGPHSIYEPRMRPNTEVGLGKHGVHPWFSPFSQTCLM